MQPEYQKSSSIRIAGLIIIIFSALIIFSNAGGVVMYTLLNPGENSSDIHRAQNAGVEVMMFLFDHYVEGCLIMVFLGLIFLIGGIFIRRFKRWAIRLLTAVSVLLFVQICGLMISMAATMMVQEESSVFSFVTILTGIVWSTPLALLIWFLNRKKIRRHFT